MFSSKRLQFAALFAFAGLLGAAGLLAQEPTDTNAPPKPAARGIPSVYDPNAPSNSPSEAVQPDTTPLTGVETPGLGTPESVHSYWVPGLHYASLIQSQPLGQSTSTSWYESNYFGGDLSLFKAWSHSQLSLNESGGGFASANSLEGNGWYDQFAAQQNFQWQRWQLQLIDQFSYLPQSQMGFGGGTGLGIPGIGGSLGPVLPGLGSGVVPNQGIYSANGPRYSNAGIVQTSYQISPRASITMSGSYGLLHFTQSGNIDSNAPGASFGFNYTLSREDTIGVVYRFGSYHYQGEPQALGDNVVSLAYSKKITQRLALQLFGGPDYTTYRVPVNGESSRITGYANANLAYGLERGSLTLNYFHGIGSGSGVLVGSNIDDLRASITRQLTRQWNGFINFGFSLNRPLQSSATQTGTDFYDWLAGAGLNRPLTRDLTFSLSYTTRIQQQPNIPGCTGLGCASNFNQQMISLTLQWHTRPYLLQ